MDANSQCYKAQSCRLCGKDDKFGVPIFSGYGKEKMLPQKIDICLPQLKVSCNDKYSQAICYKCAVCVEQFSDFCSRAMATDALLKRTWKTKPSKTVLMCQEESSDTSPQQQKISFAQKLKTRNVAEQSSPNLHGNLKFKKHQNQHDRKLHSSSAPRLNNSRANNKRKAAEVTSLEWHLPPSLREDIESGGSSSALTTVSHLLERPSNNKTSPNPRVGYRRLKRVWSAQDAYIKKMSAWKRAASSSSGTDLSDNCGRLTPSLSPQWMQYGQSEAASSENSPA